MKVKFTDSFFAEEQTLTILKELFGNVIVSDDPDFVFCSVGYSADYLKYDCARIMLIGENLFPDFNCVDYAIGFNYMEFEDRYIRIPLYCFYEDDYRRALTKHLDINDPSNKKFCNFVYSNGRDSIKERDMFYNQLSEYKHIDSGGRHLNNIGGPVVDKWEFQKQYKFSIAFENAVSNGYTTEKILQAFSAGTIPIYYGNPLIAKEFNSKAFVNCHEYDSFDDVIKRVIEIDNEPEIYSMMMKEPIFIDLDQMKEPLKKYKDFLYSICSQDPKRAIRRCNDCWGARLQKEKKEYYAFLKQMDGSSIGARIKRKLIKL